MDLSFHEMCNALNATADADNFQLSEVCVDSRQATPESLFFALKGERVDGHDFLKEVAKRGAKAAVVQKSYLGDRYGLVLIFVDDVLDALQELARYWLKSCAPRIVGVTGSVGKTTTKGFISTLLREKFRVAGSPGNANSQIGLPMSILNNVKRDDEILVQEMAMTEPGQIKRLVSIAPPEVAVVTLVTYVHACNFDQLEDIGRAKGEIFSSETTKKGFLYGESAHLCSFGPCPKDSYSCDDRDAEIFMDDQRDVFVKGERKGTLPMLPVEGEHNEQNVLAAIAVAQYFGMEWDEIVRGVKKLTLEKRRLEHVQKGGVLFVNDSYNACTASMKAALQSLPKKQGKKVAVLGEMLELGKFSDACHLEVGKAALGCVDEVICFGEACGPIVNCWKGEGRKITWTCERKELMELVHKSVCSGDVVLLKGSRSNELWKVLDDFIVD